MKYRITKECGVGWEESLDPAVAAWGVSANQFQQAQKVVPGDILLHYIDCAHAWAGYSTVTGALQENRRDSHADWLAALPYVIPIERRVWLDKHHCRGTVSIPNLSNKHYHRQVAFTSILASEAEVVIAAIVAAQTGQTTAIPEFDEQWMDGAENYYWRIARGLAGGKCQLCQDDVSKWARRTENALSKAGIALSKEDLESIRDSFLDVAHIVARRNGGPMRPDNLRALCPTCHRVVDRLPNLCERLLRGN